MPSGPPVIEELPYVDPFEAACRLSDRPRLAFLDSAMADPTLGRWSYLACEPSGVLRIVDGIATWNGAAVAGDPVEAFRRLLLTERVERAAGGPPFQGGAIGCLTYEARHLFENLPRTGDPALPQLEADFAFYEALFAFDVIDRRAFRIGREGRLPVLPPAAPAPMPSPVVADWQDSRTRRQYEDEVARVVEAIRAGDIFQANIAHRFFGRPAGPVDALATYRRLRSANPAPFAALLVDGDRFIASTSPERFLRLEGGHIETRPIKGTRRRDAESAADAAMASELAASEKDRAENTMIVDLLRNDLSRVCEPASVAVPVLCGIETYASVHHLVSVVTGRLAAGRDVFDLIAATFPGGSITGAPKIKAMEIIGSVEKAPRGPYCGSIGWIGFDGDADLNIAIRTVVHDGTGFSLHAGGGITLLSDPAEEYDETLAKAERILDALGPAP